MSLASQGSSLANDLALQRSPLANESSSACCSWDTSAGCALLSGFLGRRDTRVKELISFLAAMYLFNLLCPPQTHIYFFIFSTDLNIKQWIWGHLVWKRHQNSLTMPFNLILNDARTTNDAITTFWRVTWPLNQRRVMSTSTLHKKWERSSICCQENVTMILCSAGEPFKGCLRSLAPLLQKCTGQGFEQTSCKCCSEHISQLWSAIGCGSALYRDCKMCQPTLH